MTQTKLLLAASSACALLALPAHAKTALMDFGNASGLVTSSGGLTYNAPIFTGGATDSTGTVALNDTSGAPTGWSIDVTKTSVLTSDAGFSGAGATYGGTLPAAVAGFDPNATRDNIFFNAGDQPAGELTVTLTGLDNTKTYDLLFYGSRASVPGTQTWTLTTGSGTAPPVEHSSALNSITVVDWIGITPVGGTIAFTVSVSGGVGALNFGQVIEAMPGTALIDFNPNNAASSAYNAIPMIGGTPDSTGDVALNDTASAATGWTINVTNTAPITDPEATLPDAGNAGGAYVATFPAALADFETNALTDSIFFNQGAQPKGELTVTITGLDNAKTYDLLFYGSRSNVPGTQTWDLTVGSGTAPQVSHSSANNTTTVVDWNGIAPAGGVIAFTISVDGGVGALNFGRVSETGSGPSSPYSGWAEGGELFTGDENGDGVDNGLAWILGAASPTVSALDKLPTVSTPPGFLQLDFTREYPYAPAKLYVEYGNDLTAWTKLLIPADLGPSTIGGGIEVTVGEGPPDTIQIKIPTSHASGGKLFARLSAMEN